MKQNSKEELKTLKDAVGDTIDTQDCMNMLKLKQFSNCTVVLLSYQSYIAMQVLMNQYDNTCDVEHSVAQPTNFRYTLYAGNVPSSSYKFDKKNIWLPPKNYCLGKNLHSDELAPLCTASTVILVI